MERERLIDTFARRLCELGCDDARVAEVVDQHHAGMVTTDELREANTLSDHELRAWVRADAETGEGGGAADDGEPAERSGEGAAGGAEAAVEVVTDEDGEEAETGGDDAPVGSRGSRSRRGRS